MSMDDTQRNERQRILDMVQCSKVTPEEGDRLLTSLEQRSRGHQQCPFCAENIPAGIDTCPECRSVLVARHVPPMPSHSGRGFHSLSGLGKFLVCYTFLICGLVWLLQFGHFPPRGIASMLLALVGIAGAILICKGSRTGWVLATLWAGVQILPVVAAGVLLNRQILHVGILSTRNGSGMGFNLVGLILLILFIRATPRETSSSTAGRR